MTAAMEKPSLTRMISAPESALFSVPARHNPRLQSLVERIHQDDELRQLWRCANSNLLTRPDLADGGEVHAHIVANAALKLLRLMRDAGHPAGAVARHRLTPEEAEVIVVLAAAVHDLGLAVHTEVAQAARASLMLAERKCRELLTGLYPVRERTIVLVECLHAVSALEPGVACGSLEASLVKLADALDLAKSRGRPASSMGDAEVSAFSSAGIEEVRIEKAKGPPVRIVIRLSQLSARDVVERRLQSKLRGLQLGSMVEFVASLGDQPGAGRLPVAVWNGQA
jgi:metal-dependent HD superfamily phosphatase/phosphodiesterase